MYFSATLGDIVAGSWSPLEGMLTVSAPRLWRKLKSVGSANADAVAAKTAKVVGKFRRQYMTSKCGVEYGNTLD